MMGGIAWVQASKFCLARKSQNRRATIEIVHWGLPGNGDGKLPTDASDKGAFAGMHESAHGTDRPYVAAAMIASEIWGSTMGMLGVCATVTGGMIRRTRRSPNARPTRSPPTSGRLGALAHLGR